MRRTAQPRTRKDPRVATRAPLVLAGLLVAAALPPAVSPGLPAPAPVLAQEARASVVAAGEGLPGTAAAGLLLRRMDGVKRVLVIGAHPDDEDTSLLAALARGWGARAAYLSLTRGEGGQNLIGSELGEGLGLVRTGELLAARRLDGAEQFFTRAYDFGYSKRAEETFRHWPRDSLLSDVVWVVRTFRPQVIVSAFSGTSRDGHGQHQVAGILAREAFEAAGDPSRFPEHLRRGAEPWTPLKLYRRTWRDPGSSTLEFETGRFDPLLGRSWFQLAMASRSQHRSQDFGTAQPAGPRATLLGLVESRVPGPDTSLFAGVDTTLAGLAVGMAPGEGDRARAEGGAERVRDLVGRYRAAVSEARDRLGALDPSHAVPALGRALAAAREVGDVAEGAGAEGLRRAMRRRVEIAGRALLAAASIELRLRADDDVVVPGQRFEVTAELWNGGPVPVRAAPPALSLPAGWTAGEPEAAGGAAESPVLGVDPTDEAGRPAGRAPGGSGVPVPPGEIRRWGFTVRVAPDAEPTEPYFLRRPRNGDLYRWPEDPALRARPLSPPPVTGSIELDLDAAFRAGAEPGASGPGVEPGRVGRDAPVRVTATATARYRGVDKASGEFWRPLHVAPALSVSVDSDVLVWPVGRDGARTVTLSARSRTPAALEGTLSLEAPRGWIVAPPELPVALPGPGAVRSAAFELRTAEGSRTAAEDADTSGADWNASGAGPGSYRMAAVASVDGRRFGTRATFVDHPHIEPALRVEEAGLEVRRFPVEVERDRRVGYVMGSGDEVPAAIEQLGLEVDELDDAALREGRFEPYDVIVLGVRAYETRPALAGANARLLDWARGGGTLLVQYNKYEFVEGAFAPYPLCIDRPHDRVTDETAPVTLLEPGAPVFTDPNRIGPEDWEGWVQERGLYFGGDWDPRYTPLLGMADPGEETRRGALLVAPVGEGLYAYTGLAFFRQLPAGVPGAYRLFANLLSLEPAEWRAFAAGAGEGALRAPTGAPGSDEDVSCGNRFRR